MVFLGQVCAPRMEMVSSRENWYQITMRYWCRCHIYTDSSSPSSSQRRRQERASSQQSRSSTKSRPLPTDAETDPFAAFRSYQQGAMLKSMGLGRGAFESGLRPPTSTGAEQQRDAISKPALSRGWFARPEFTGLFVAFWSTCISPGDIPVCLITQDDRLRSISLWWQWKPSISRSWSNAKEEMLVRLVQDYFAANFPAHTLLLS